MKGRLKQKGKVEIKRKVYNKVDKIGELGECYLCGESYGLETHHIFGKSDRTRSDKLGLVVRLCSRCHRTDEHAVHQDYDVNLWVKKKGQEAFEKVNSRDEFMELFGRNYL